MILNNLDIDPTYLSLTYAWNTLLLLIKLATFISFFSKFNNLKKLKKMSICTNHCTNQNKVRKTIPTTMPTMFKKWQNSKEKCQAHNLKVVG